MKQPMLLTLILVISLTFGILAQDDELVMPEVTAEAGEIILEEVAADTTASQTPPPLEKMPEQIHFEEAVYPEDLYKQGIEGDVILSILVNPAGTVDSVEIVQGINPILDTNALKAAKKFTFTPGIAGGEAVPVAIQYAYHFSVDEVADGLASYINFKGKVEERGTRIPLPNALIILQFPDSTYDLPVPMEAYLKKLGTMEGQFIEEGYLATLSDSLGNFSFSSLPVGKMALSIPQAGYEIFNDTLTITPKEVTSATLYLRKISYDEYEVTAYYKGEETEVTRHQLTIQEMRKIPGLGGDAIKVVQTMPGVARASFGGGDIVIRGTNTYDSKFLLDGAEIPLLYHFGGLKSTYNSEALKTIDFYPGGWGSTYGNAIGGVVDLTSRNSKDDRWHGTVDVSTLDASFVMEGPIGDKVSILASARRSYFGEIVDAILRNPDINAPLTVTPFYWDYVARVDVKLNEKNTLFVSNFGSFDSLRMHVDNADLGSDEINKATDGVSQQLFFNRAGAGWNTTLSDKLKNELYYYYLFKRSSQSIFGFAAWDDTLHANQFRDNFNMTLTEKSAFNVGVNGYFGWYDMALVILDANNVPKRDSLSNWFFANVGVYANFTWRPTEKLLIIPGIRYDYYAELLPEESNNFSVRFLTRYNFYPKHTIKFAAGTYNQTPQPMGFVIHPTWGEPDMPATRASHTVLGYEWQITDLLSLDVQGYFNYQWAIPRSQSSSDIDTTNYEDTRLWYADEEGRLYGLEILLRHNQSERFFGWLAYSFSRSERQGPYNEDWVLFSKDQTHNLQLLGSWRLNHNWEIGGRIRFVTGNPTTPIDSTSISVDGHSYIPHYGIENSTRTAPFFQVDTRAEKKFIFKKSILSVYLDIQNLLSFAYKSPEFEFYDDFYEEKIVVSLPIIPALGVRYEF